MSSKSCDMSNSRAGLHFDIFTLFPQMFVGPLSESILKRAQVNELMTVALHNIRDYTVDRHHVCDEPPYGGGGGMVMKPEPIVRAVETVLTRPAGWTLDASTLDASTLPALADDSQIGNPQPGDPHLPAAQDSDERLPPWDSEVQPALPADVPVILLTPQGRLFSQSIAEELSKHRRLALICGRYEGVDERVRTQVVTDEISIGDYVLSGGEPAALVLIDAVTRLLPGALGAEQGAFLDSHSPGLDGLLEGPHYTRPPVFRGENVPPVLFSGHHARVAQWRREQALLRTLHSRPELLAALSLTAEDYTFLESHLAAQDRRTTGAADSTEAT